MQHITIHLKDHFPFLGENGCDPLLTTYLPYNMTEMKRQDWKRPAILLCPGGGYAMVSQREGEVIGLHFLPEGYNVFILNYSVKPNRFPTQLREVAAAMELIYANADSWNCDTDHIAIMGFSAGGHLAAHYSTCFDCAEVREAFAESKAVNASILCYPVITADPAHSHKGSFKNLTGLDEITEEAIEKFSCDRNVSEHTPPAFIWHTASDATVPVMNSLLYAGALAKYKIPTELHIYPYGKHGLSTVDSQTNKELDEKTIHAAQWLPALKNWLKVIF
jgi:acetyl esterase/lipase